MFDENGHIIVDPLYNALLTMRANSLCLATRNPMPNNPYYWAGDILEQGVLHHIRTVMWLVANYEEKFRAALGAMQKPR